MSEKTTIMKSGRLYVYWVSSNGDLHREDGPAVEWKDGYKEWFINGQRHRLDGPAIENLPSNTNEWYVHGEHINCKTQEEFERLMRLKAFW